MGGDKEKCALKVFLKGGVQIHRGPREYGDMENLATISSSGKINLGV